MSLQTSDNEEPKCFHSTVTFHKVTHCFQETKHHLVTLLIHLLFFLGHLLMFTVTFPDRHIPPPVHTRTRLQKNTYKCYNTLSVCSNSVAVRAIKRVVSFVQTDDQVEFALNIMLKQRNDWQVHFEL